jgi:precorrin-4 methylase
VSVVHFIGAGPGAPDLITVRGLALIRRCPVVLYAGSLVPRAVVDEAPKGARVIDTAPMHLDQIIAAPPSPTARKWRACIPATHRSMALSANRCAGSTRWASPMT